MTTTRRVSASVGFVGQPTLSSSLSDETIRRLLSQARINQFVQQVNQSEKEIN